MPEIKINKYSDSDVKEQADKIANILANNMENTAGKVVVWAGPSHVRLILEDDSDCTHIPLDSLSVNYIQDVKGSLYIGIES